MAINRFYITVLLVLFIRINFTVAQDLSFSNPVNFLPDVKTDKAIDITNFNGNFFVTWKESGETGQVHVSYLGKQYDTAFGRHEDLLAGSQSAYAPVLRVLNNRIYLFWIEKNGSLKYIINNSASGFNTKSIYTLSFTNNAKLSGGITSAALGKKLMIASHADNKTDAVYAVTDVKADGTLAEASLKTIPGIKSADYPFLIAFADSAARITYRGYKEQNIYFIDYQAGADKWLEKQNYSQSNVSPAIYHVLNSDWLFYIWKGAKDDNKIYYNAGKKENKPAAGISLPENFSTGLPVSICTVDDKKFIMSYVGQDQKIYLSYFTNYNPSRWMENILFPAKEKYTIKDIVIPGAHDAGMSVLNGTGGMQSNTINECNTLTQTQDIKGQLNSGIRMFDLRVGSYKDELYTKHCSSDCMADAIGGGYGEKFSSVLSSIKQFLNQNKKEFILVSLSHFCEKEASVKDVGNYMIDKLGKDIIYPVKNKAINEIPLTDLAGKIIITFENYASTDNFIDSCTISLKSNAFVNFRREYAASNVLEKMMSLERNFFSDFTKDIKANDLVRLDWQLTQASDEAAMICNDFENEKVNPLVNGAMLLTNIVRKHKSIRDLSIAGNKSLPLKVNEWISSGVINQKNKPNILYVDVAGGWITDYCIELNKSNLYNK